MAAASSSEPMPCWVSDAKRMRLRGVSLEVIATHLCRDLSEIEAALYRRARDGRLPSIYRHRTTGEEARA
jgi:hypothetical protein